MRASSGRATASRPRFSAAHAAAAGACMADAASAMCSGARTGSARSRAQRLVRHRGPVAGHADTTSYRQAHGQVVDARRGLRRDVHAAARHHGRERRAAVHRARPERLVRGPAVGDRRLRAHARRVPAHGRLDRRRHRPPARLRGRARGLHRRLGAVRAGRLAADAQPRARPAGRRRRHDVRHRAGAAGVRLPGPRPRHRDRPVGSDDRRRRGDRAAGRRRARRGERLGVDLLRQRADRHRGDRAHAGARAGVARPARRAARLGRHDRVLGRPLPAVFALIRGNAEDWSAAIVACLAGAAVLLVASC